MSEADQRGQSAVEDGNGAVPEAARGDHFVQSLERGLAVIRAFGPDKPELTLSEVGRATELTRAAARRFLLTLVDLGYVRTDGRLFSLTPRVLELGYAYLSSLKLPEIAEPHLEALVEEVHESSSMAVLDGDDIVHIAWIPATRIMSAAISVGTRFPAYATSMGRVLLGGLEKDELDEYLARTPMKGLTKKGPTTRAAMRKEIERVRSQGFALVDQELEEGLQAVAAPLHNRDGEMIAAVNICAHASRRPRETMRRELVPPLLAAAERIEADLRLATPSQRPASA